MRAAREDVPKNRPIEYVTIPQHARWHPEPEAAAPDQIYKVQDSLESRAIAEPVGSMIRLEWQPIGTQAVIIEMF